MAPKDSGQGQRADLPSRRGVRTRAERESFDEEEAEAPTEPSIPRSLLTSQGERLSSSVSSQPSFSENYENRSRHAGNAPRERPTASLSQAAGDAPAARASDPAAALPPLLTKFIAFDEKQYASCSSFCRHSGSIWREDFSRLETLAGEYLRMGQLNDARRVAQRYLMLSVASRQPSPNDYLDGLKVQKQRAVFETLLRQYLEQLRATVDQAERDRPDTRSQRSGNDTTTFRPGRSSAEQLQISQAFSQPSSLGSTQGTGAHDRHNRQPSRPSQPPRTQSSTSGLPAAHQDRRYRSGSDVSDLDTTAGGPSLIGMGRGLGLGLPTLAEDDIERLEKGFKVHTGAKLKTVFQRGSLVVVFWHENYGSSLPPKKLETLRPPPKDGKLGPGWVSRVEGEVVYSHKRRFIIVNERSGFSVGIPITSYGGRGLTIKNMSREEQRAHAIVYTLDSEPRPLPGEPPFTKDPICIDTSISGETLSSSSRLYYAKPQSIDHNIKIKHLGKVIDSDVRTLLLNYRAENLPQVQ